jgi:hypothetical protein
VASAGSWIKRKWHDPVWSKVIANAIWALVVARHLKLPKIVVDDAIASLRARNWLWDQSSMVMLSEVGRSVAVKNNWHKDELLL